MRTGNKPKSLLSNLQLKKLRWFILLIFSISITACHSTQNSFNKGDSIYISHKFCETLYRLVRPIVEQDIDTMKLSDADKNALKLKLNPLAKPYLIMTGNCVSTTAKSKSIGQYIEQEKLTIHNPSNNTFHESTFYIIHPNKENLTIGESYYKEPGPSEGYIWANHNYYLSAKGAFTTQQQN